MLHPRFVKSISFSPEHSEPSSHFVLRTMSDKPPANISHPTARKNITFIYITCNLGALKKLLAYMGLLSKRICIQAPFGAEEC